MKERVYKIGNSTITIKFGNIITSNADVIVSSDDTGITMGGGVSRCIRKAGGNIVREDAQKKLPAFLGDVVVSTAGNLPCQYIFHCLTIDYHDRGITFYQNKLYGKTTMNEYIVRHNIEECCRLMQALNINSIAFPLIGTGTAQLDMETTAEVISETLADYLSKTSRPYQIELYLFDKSKNKEEEIYYEYRHIFECFFAQEKLHTKDKVNNLEEYGTEEPEDFEESNNEVFVSFSQIDKEDVEKYVIQVLKEAGISYFAYDEQIYSGRDYWGKIAKAIKNATVSVLVSTKHSLTSREVIDEIKYSIKNKKTVIPFKLDDTQYPDDLDLRLCSIDHIDIKIHQNAAEKLITAIKFATKRKWKGQLE